MVCDGPFTDDDHRRNIRRSIEHCLRGDVFQIVVSRRFIQSYEGDDFTLYRVTSSGGLEVVEDYTVANGVVTYTTDYISNLVFVGTAPVAGFPWWIIPIIAAALVLTLALAILIAVLVKLHRAPDPIPVEVTPIDSIMPEPPVPAPAASVAPWRWL